MQQIRIGLLALIVGAVLAFPVGTQAAGSDKFIPTFLVYYGGGPQLVSGDAAKLAKFDLIDIDRFRYQDIGPNTWAAIKAINPDVQIYLYEMGPEAPSHLDGTLPLYLNGLGRYNVSRGHFMGSLNGNHPELFQLNGAGQRVYSVGFSNVGANQYWHLMDFGASNYQSYWLAAARADIVDQPWAADGIFVDNCLTLPGAGGYSATSTIYPTNAAWSAAMNTFVEAITNGMRGYGQKLWCNRGESRSSVGSAAWLSLDNGASPPDVLLEEGAFAVEWGSDTQFYPEQEWKRQIDTIAAIRNSKVALMSHTKLMEGQSGTDNWGKPVSYWQTLWYSLGSFLLAKNDELGNAYFMFNGGSGYNRIWWHDEYDKIDLGRALGGYRVTPVGGVNIYWREFERGHVYVNPTDVNIATLALPQAARLLSRATLGALLDTLPLVNSIALNGHHAAFVLKADPDLPPLPDTAAPTVPAGLSASVVSASQVNLSWSASSDNVGVTGYRVYLNDALLATTAATSFSHTGLAAGTTYSYRVSAYDAVPNHSAWSAAPVTASTPASDATAPSVPAGLTATVVSATQVNLSWSASTDNVGVTGYYVYLNDAPLATTTATSFSHTGLSAGVTYNYRVSAYDAVPNHSAWTAVPVSASTPASDATAPSVPAGLTATVVSATQVNLSWSASTDNVGVTGYRVYLNDALLATTATTSFAHTGLTPGATYNYRVSAYDAVPNHSAWSPAPVTATTPAPDTVAPTVPAGLSASVVSASQVNLAWSASTDNVGVTGYRVYLNNAPLATTAATSFSHTGLTPGATYNYRVSAFDAVPNHSAWSATPVTATTPVPDTTAPTVPAGLTATAVSATQVNLAWSASTDNVGVVGYYVYLNNAPLATTTSTSFAHAGLTAGATYNYRVSAFDAVPNHSAWSATPVTATTPVSDSTAPSVSITSPAAYATVSGTITVTAGATDNVGVVGVQFRFNGAKLGPEDTSAPFTATAYTKSVPNGNYKLTAVARDAAGNKRTSAPITIRVRN